MLHEIILSLSGHSSPLLTANAADTTSSLLSPPEKALLATAAHLSELHRNIRTECQKLAATSRSSVCQSVATNITSQHLAQFQQVVLETERSILSKDSSSVGAYNIVPLTAVIGNFSEWTQRLEWLWDITQFTSKDGCTGTRLINKLNLELQTGYSDIEELALSLGRIAESAWLKQASCWVLYGRLPSFGQEDFFLKDAGNGEFKINYDLLPHFVSKSTAKSIQFIGKSLNQIRLKSETAAASISGLLPKHLEHLSSLEFPITPSNMTNVVLAIRSSLSQNALQDLLPLSKIQDALRMFHNFFLLNNGEFAIALVNEADEKIKSRWQRSDNLAYENRAKLGDVIMKDGEVAAVLTKTWASMLALSGLSEEDEDELEMARELVTLTIQGPSNRTPKSAMALPFHTSLLSVPTALSLKIASPLDLFLSKREIDMYSSVNAYLLSVRRAHQRLSNLWKLTSLRRHHPAPPPPPVGSTAEGRETTQRLRERARQRNMQMRSVWATSSATLYLLGELEAYFQGEVIRGTWEGFQEWITGTKKATSRPSTSTSKAQGLHDAEGDIDMWSRAGEMVEAGRNPKNTHDPQTLSAAHQRFLISLRHQLLLTSTSFTGPLFDLLQKVDYIVALVHRIHTIWTSIDLEEDQGVVDAFSDFQRELSDVEVQLAEATGNVKEAIGTLVAALRVIDQAAENREDELEQLEAQVEDFVLNDEDAFRPMRVGRVDRLLMKLDFGGWLEPEDGAGDEMEQEIEEFS